MVSTLNMANQKKERIKKKSQVMGDYREKAELSMEIGNMRKRGSG